MLKSKLTLIGFLSLAIALTFHSNANAQLELTSNGTFELGDATGWQSFASGTQTFGVTSDAASGLFAGELNNNLTGSALVIKQANLGIGTVVAGETITISFDAKGEGVAGGVVFAEFFSELTGGGTSKAEILGSGPLTLTNAYQSFNFTTTAGSDVSGGVTLQFNAATGANAGSTSTLFVDNASVTIVRSVPEPASASIILLAGFGMLLRRRR